MATIPTSTETRVYTIDEWLGVNESPDGDTGLKMGEAAEIRNWRITRDGNLQIRPGTKTIWSFDGPVRGMWSGRVMGRQVFVCAAGGKLYELGGDEPVQIGELTDAPAHFFGFALKLYILNGHEYMVWSGEGDASPVEGYRPLVTTSTLPGGGGAELEPVNRLTGKKRARYSPDGSAKVFFLPEQGLSSIDFVISTATGEDVGGWTGNTELGTVTFAEAPAQGTDSIEIGWTAASDDWASVAAMRFSEFYSGSTDNRVFLYGDGSNHAFYSGIDYNGLPTAEYFPELNVLDAGTANSPITGMVRHFSRLLVFKSDSTFSAQFSTITLADGRVTEAFYTAPVNREVGNLAPGQVRIVNNNPRSLHGQAVYEWKSGGGNINYDERSAKHISGRINATLGSFDLENCVCFDDEIRQEYYIVHEGTAIVHNYDDDVWYIYTNVPANDFVVHNGELYVSTSTGQIRHVSRNYRNDDEAPIDAYWRSGSMAFDKEWMRKYSSMLFVTLKPESGARVTVTAMSNRKSDYPDKIVSSSLATFEHVDFAHWSFRTNRKPQVTRLKLKVKKVAFYQLIFESNSASATATVLSVNIHVRYTGNVK